MKYENRVVAFLDILGFKDILDNTITLDVVQNEKNIDIIINAFKSIRDVWDLDEKKEPFAYRSKEGELIKSKKEITMFSDCVLISFPYYEPSEVFHTLVELQWVIMRLLNFKIICRGGITFGDVIHNSKIMFGPAIVEAYKLEKDATYPRVILSEKIIELGSLIRSHNTYQQEKEYIKQIVTKDEDGLYYIDYFQKAQGELDDPLYDFPEYLYNLGEIIKNGLIYTDTDIKKKYEWMRDKYNSVIRLHKNKDNINRLYGSGESEIADFFLEAQEIP